MNCPFVIKKCKKCGELLVAYEGNFHKHQTGKYGLRGECKKCRNEYHRKYNQEHNEERKKTWNKYYKNHKEEKLERSKRYNKTERGKQSRKISNKKQKHKRRALTKGKIYTNKQIEEMNLFFNNCCAYSGIKLINNNYSIDHIVPLSEGGENLIWNLVPMDIKLNSSKGVKDFLEWYKKQEFYSEERLDKIYQWIEYAKNKWGRED